MLKKISLMLFLAMLLAISSISVFADVLIEPEDSFYKQHQEECHPHQKYYTALKEVTVHQNPTVTKALDTASAGSNFYIEWIYTAEDGAKWGLYEGRDFSYWVSMDSLEPIYSHDEFVSDHASSITDAHEAVNIDQEGWIAMYEYPGSEWICDILKTEWISDDSLIVSSLYTDAQGVRWGYTPYYMQHKGWICLDDAVSQSEPVYNAPVIFIPKQTSPNDTLIGMLVIGVCIISAALASILYHRKSKLHF